MNRSSAWVAVIAVGVLIAACGDDDGRGPADTGPADAVTPPPPPGPPPPPMDAGPDGATPDGATPDARPDLGLDAGPGLGLDVCDPRDPASCEEGASCKVVGSADGAQFTCRFGGSVAEGEPCSFALVGFDGAFFGDDCAGGLICLSEGEGAGLACVRPCASSDECDAGERCRLFGIAIPPFARVGTCRAPASCDPTDGSGCPSGERCIGTVDTDLVPGSYCEPIGALGEGEICANAESCGLGLTCSVLPLPAGGFDLTMPADPRLEPARCLRQCDAGDPSDPACSAATTGCVALSPDADPPFSGGICRLPHEAPIGPDDRPARVVVPQSYDGTRDYPLVVAVHGFTSSGRDTDGVLRLTRQAERDGFLLVTPDGTRNPDRVPYWNVAPQTCTRAPCPDDGAYLVGLVDAMKTRYRVDAGRVYLLGISNGALMSYRLACDAADVFTAIASLAGATPLDAASCMPARPVSVLEIHGDADANVPFAGREGVLRGTLESVQEWAGRDGCDVTMPEMGEPFDLDTTIDGDETTVTRYATGCMAGTDVELWTTSGGDHFIFGRAADDFSSRVTTWLLRHSR